MIITCLLVIFENYCAEIMTGGQIKTVDVKPYLMYLTGSATEQYNVVPVIRVYCWYRLHDEVLVRVFCPVSYTDRMSTVTGEKSNHLLLTIYPV